MRLVKIAMSMAMVLGLTLAPVEAAPKGSKGPSSTKASSAKAPKVTKTTTAPKATKAPKVTTTKITGAPTAKAPKASKAPAKVDTKLAKSAVKSAKKAGTTTTSTVAAATTTSSSTTTTDTTTPVTDADATATATTIDFTEGKVAEKLAKNSNLRTKLETRLQAAGYEGTVYQAAYGFKNQGQFIAAANVAQNTGVSFEQLKLQMTGLSIDAEGVVLKANLAPDGTITTVDPAEVTNPAPTKSLGQALQTVKSGVDVTAAVQTATQQADAEIAATER